MKKKYVEQGFVRMTHGVRGEVKLQLWCGDPSPFYKIRKLYLDEEGKKPLTVVSSHGSSSVAVVKFEGVDTVEAAAALKGKTVYVDRDDLHLPADKILVCDLIGLPVIDADTGRIYGTVGSVEDYPASDIYMVDTEHGVVQVPDVPQFIKKLTDEAVYITPIEGMF